MLILLLLSIAGCGSPAIEGQVINSSGQPLSGVQITVLGSQDCQTQTDKEGRYSLDCISQEKDRDCTKPDAGCAPPTLDFKLAGHFPGLDNPTPGDLTSTTLRLMPTTPGIYLKKGLEHEPLERGILERKLAVAENGGKSRTYCVVRTTDSPNRVTGNKLSVFSNRATQWRVFRLDKTGCAYRDARNPEGKWQVEYRDNPHVTVESLGDGQDWSRIAVQPGEYFLADWEGFFVPTEANGDNYSGTWIQVSG